MIKEAIGKVVEHKALTAVEMDAAFSEIMSGIAAPSQIAAFITGLRMKGETVTEITAAATVMRRFARTIDIQGGLDIDRSDINIEREVILDTCGTGGSGTNTFNISTTVAFVVAGCGIKIAKHGNRSVSSACGSADVLEALGINLDIAPSRVEECIKRIGIGFMYAPLFHKAMKHAAGVRKAIGIRTIFNILGPLSNPANATCQVLGVYSRELTEVMAKVLCKLGLKKAFVVYGLDTLDEISVTGPTQISELKGNKVKTYQVRPEQFGFKRMPLKSIAGGDAAKNSRIVLSVLKGAKGAKRDVVLINAAYGLIAAGKAVNVKEALKMAEYSIDSGMALNKLNQLQAFTRLSAGRARKGTLNSISRQGPARPRPLKRKMPRL